MFFSKLVKGQTVPVWIDYKGLVIRLENQKFAKCDDLDQFLFQNMKDRFEDDYVFKSLKFIYEELSNKLINLIQSFASKSKFGVKFNQLKGIAIKFDTTGNQTLDMLLIEEDILVKPSDEFTEQSKHFEKAESPFESKMIPKTYNSKIAALTVKFA